MIAVALLLLPFSAASGAAVPGAVGKVVKLLTDMQTQLMDDKKADEEMYEKLSCWCKVNGDGKGTAVEIATAKVADLNSRISSLTAKSSELEEAIKQVESEVAANSQALDTATSMRDEGLQKFRDDEKDMLVNVMSLKNALVVLEKNLDTSFLQMSADLKKKVRNVVNNAKADEILQQILNPSDRNTLTAFMQGKLSTGSPQGGEIMGILKQMKTEMESNLADMQADEKKAVTEFAGLKEAKTSEIAAGEEMAKEKTALLGKTKVQLAEAKEDLRTPPLRWRRTRRSWWT
jgi:6-pyruvoyl-tetrahydropterin synthase